jgi:predicted nucleic acid-binding protein
MILVDTSIWINVFSHKSRVSIPIQYYPLLCTCGPIVQEVLQGISSVHEHRVVKDGLLSLSMVANPLPIDIFIEAGELFASGRKRGLTIRSSVDCLIAAIAIKNNLTLLHRDRDFKAIATFTNLQVIEDLGSVRNS